jgi:hypothetical protein
MWPWSKTRPEPIAGLRETFFGDMPLSAWTDGKPAEPWTDFVAAERAVHRGDRSEATRILQSIVQRGGLESRHYVQAWNALRELGLPPASDEAKHVYGVVVDMPVKSGFDTLAAYEDLSARYLNFSGAAIIWDAPDSRMDDHRTEAAGGRPGPCDADRTMGGPASTFDTSSCPNQPSDSERIALWTRTRRRFCARFDGCACDRCCSRVDAGPDQGSGRAEGDSLTGR